MVKEVFGGVDRNALTKAFINDLNMPPAVDPEYLVFHVSECSLAESMLRKFHYGSEAVIDATVELADSFNDEIHGDPLLLFENLWYPGLDMLEPELTGKLLDNVKYQNTGVMLDIGHLLCTNTELRTIEEGVGYIHGVLDRYQDLSFIRGVHLHQSLSGEYANELMRTWIDIDGDYNERRRAVFPHIYKIDTHQPFVSERVNEIIERIKPDYLVVEQLSSDRREHKHNLEKQMRFLH
jgi:hypothetical protein